MRRSKPILPTLIIVLVGILIVALSIGADLIVNTYTGTVTDKERVVTNEESYYLVFVDLPDGGNTVFKNTDVWWRGKFNSSNVQGALGVGETYTFTVSGLRLPLFNGYQNIIDYEELDGVA